MFNLKFLALRLFARYLFSFEHFSNDFFKEYIVKQKLKVNYLFPDKINMGRTLYVENVLESISFWEMLKMKNVSFLI